MEQIHVMQVNPKITYLLNEFNKSIRIWSKPVKYMLGLDYVSKSYQTLSPIIFSIKCMYLIYIVKNHF